jgi:hypothetical protein
MNDDPTFRYLKRKEDEHKEHLRSQRMKQAKELIRYGNSAAAAALLGIATSEPLQIPSINDLEHRRNCVIELVADSKLFYPDFRSQLQTSLSLIDLTSPMAAHELCLLLDQVRNAPKQELGSLLFRKASDFDTADIENRLIGLGYACELFQP